MITGKNDELDDSYLALNFEEYKDTRICLRKMKENDAEDLFRIRSDEIVNRYINRQKATSVNEVAQWIAKRNDDIDKNVLLYWAISLRENDRLIGTACFFNINNEKRSGEIGYELMPEYQGQGYVSESLKILIKHIFEKTGITQIDAVIEEGNESSLKIVRRFNFKKNETKHIREDSKTLLVYSLYPAKLPE